MCEGDYFLVNGRRQTTPFRHILYKIQNPQFRKMIDLHDLTPAVSQLQPYHTKEVFIASFQGVSVKNIQLDLNVSFETAKIIHQLCKRVWWGPNEIKYF